MKGAVSEKLGYKKTLSYDFAYDHLGDVGVKVWIILKWVLAEALRYKTEGGSFDSR
jgi:hypothetical protein